MTLAGDTTGAAADAASTCKNGDAAPDMVYQFTVTGTGTATFLLNRSPQSSLTPLMVLRKDDCANDSATVFCAAFGGADQAKIGLEITPGTYYLFASGKNGTSGAYTLDVSLAAATCGDGVVNTGEQCDDGNQDPTDGCDQCTFSLNPANDVCPGETIDLVANVDKVYAGSNVPYHDDYQAVAQAPYCGETIPPEAGGKDRVYAVKPLASGTLTASVGYDSTGTIDICAVYGIGGDPGCWDRVLYAYGPGGCTGSNQVACSDRGLEDVEIITFPVVANLTYNIIIDGYFNDPSAWGTYNLHLFLQSP